MTRHVNPEDLNRDQLIERVMELEGQLAARKEIVGDAMSNLQKLLGLTWREASILEMLSDGKCRTKEQLMSGLYWDRHDDETPEIKIIDVFVCKIRNKISGSGILIETVWGVGYKVVDPAPLQKVIAGEAPAVASTTDERGTSWRPEGYEPKRKYGEAAGLLLDLVRERRRPDGWAALVSRDIVAHTKVASASALVDAMERSGRLTVQRNGRHEKGAPWVLRVSA